jgi:signal transduction histidine kinase
MLRDHLDAADDHRASTYIAKIQGASDRLKLMIEGVLAYSSVNSTQQPVEKVDLNAIIAQVQNDLEILIHEKNAEIVSGQLPVIEGAGVLLYQLFYNLFNNSLKFTRKGVRPQITVKAEEAGSDGRPAVRISVADNGIGFSNEYAERIFETFLRLNTKDQYEGTGLGLALCKKIAERHGGTISAQGANDKGALFTVLLPLHQQHGALI